MTRTCKMVQGRFHCTWHTKRTLANMRASARSSVSSATAKASTQLLCDNKGWSLRLWCARMCFVLHALAVPTAVQRSYKRCAASASLEAATLWMLRRKNSPAYTAPASCSG